MTHRVFNFSAGPAVLPEKVLRQAQSELLSLGGIGMSVMEISHRSSDFQAILDSAKHGLRQLLRIPDDYRILFLQGGSRLQFSMVPMNFLRPASGPANYLLTGSWGKKGLEEARRQGDVHICWDGAATGYDRIPSDEALDISQNAAYVHVTSNETIQGVQFLSEPKVGDSLLIADSSSDFLCRPLPIQDYGLIYACAQKNAGPAGVTVVVIREDLLQRCPDDLPGYLNYKNHADNDSTYNTPPTFAVYIVDLVAKWLLEEIGGLDAMFQQNRRKSQLLYDVIDESDGFYIGHAEPASRSVMNVTFRFSDDQLQARFLSEAADRDLVNLKGHRSVGGIRASIYNAMPVAGVEALRDLMRDFIGVNG